MLCQKQTPRQIELMLATMNIIPTVEIDLNIVMADMEKAREQRETFPANFQEETTGEREVRWRIKETGNDQRSNQQTTKREKMKNSSGGTANCQPGKKLGKDNEDEGSTGGVMNQSDQSSQLAKEPIWMVPNDQEVEEWNLGTGEETKTIRVNKNLPESFKQEARKVFEE